MSSLASTRVIRGAAVLSHPDAMSSHGDERHWIIRFLTTDASVNFVRREWKMVCCTDKRQVIVGGEARTEEDLLQLCMRRVGGESPREFSHPCDDDLPVFRGDARIPELEDQVEVPAIKSFEMIIFVRVYRKNGADWCLCTGGPPSMVGHTRRLCPTDDVVHQNGKAPLCKGKNLLSGHGGKITVG